MDSPKEAKQLLKEWDEDFKELKSLYKKALEDNLRLFLFQGEEMLTSFAKYLIESYDER